MVDDACLSQVNSLKEPGFHLECVVHREEAQNHFCVDHGCTLIQCSISTLPLWHVGSRLTEKNTTKKSYLYGSFICDHFCGAPVDCDSPIDA